MAVRDDRSDVKQTTAGFRGPLMVQSLTSAKSKFLSLMYVCQNHLSMSKSNKILAYSISNSMPKLSL